MKTLTNAGVKVGIGIAPIIPGYNDSTFRRFLEKARENGATKAFINLIHFDSDSIAEYLFKD